MNDYLLTYLLVRRRRKRNRCPPKAKGKRIEAEPVRAVENVNSLIGLTKTILGTSHQNKKSDTGILGKSKTIIPDLSPFMVDISPGVETEKLYDFEDESEIDYDAEAILLKPVSLTANVTIEEMERLGETLNAVNEASEKAVLDSSGTLASLNGTELYEQVQKSERLHLLRERFSKISIREAPDKASSLQDMSKMFENK